MCEKLDENRTQFTQLPPARSKLDAGMVISVSKTTIVNQYTSDVKSNVARPVTDKEAQTPTKFKYSHPGYNHVFHEKHDLKVHIWASAQKRTTMVCVCVCVCVCVRVCGVWGIIFVN